jgi:inner membrane protein
MIVATNLPDADVVVTWLGHLAYLVHHRGIKHSFVGIALQAAGLAAVVYGIGLVRAGRPPDRERPSFPRLVLLSAIGLSGHLLLDYTNSYGVRPFQPFVDEWIYGDLVFIVDPWLWLVIGGALFVSAPRKRPAHLLFGVLFALLTLLIALGVRSNVAAPGAALWVWLGSLLVLLVLRKRVPPRHAHVVARVALAGVVAYWAALAVMNEIATRQVASTAEAASRGLGADRLHALPTALYPNRWRVVGETSDSIVVFDVDVLGAAPGPPGLYFRNVTGQEASAALGSCAGKVARWFNRFLAVDVVSNGDGTKRVLLRDIRFPKRDTQGVGTTVVTLGPELEPSRSWSYCPQ